MLKWNFLQFMPMVIPPVTWHHYEKSVCISLVLSIRYLYTLRRSPRAFSSLGWTVPAISLSSCLRLQALTVCGISPDPLQYAWGAQDSKCISSGQNRGERSFHLTCLQRSSQCSSGHCWISLLQEHTTVSWSTWRLPRPWRPFLTG